MKRIAILLLTILYLIPAIGFSINAHSCGNRIMAVSIDSSEPEKCSCGNKMPDGCCKNLHADFKLTDNQKAASELTISKNDFAKQILGFPFPAQFVLYAQANNFESPNYHAPPPDGKLPVYLDIRVFRI